MLERIKQSIFRQFNPEEKKGVFFSWYDAAQTLIFSEGVVQTDKPLRQIIETVYTEFVQARLNEVRYLVADVVSEIIELGNQEEIFKLSPQEFGFVVVDIDDGKTGVMLPNVSGATDVKTVLFAIRQKYGTHGKVELYAFRTERFIVAK